LFQVPIFRYQLELLTLVQTIRRSV